MISLRVKPTRQLFFDEDTLFGIYGAEVNPEDITENVTLNKYGNISFKGNMPKLKVGEEYHVVVAPDKSSNFQGSYTLTSIKQEKPVTVTEQKTYLSEILTPLQVKAIYEVYSEDDNIIDLIENNQFDYQKVKGLGETTYKRLAEKVMSNLNLSEILAFCAKHKIKYSMLAKLVKQYPSPTVLIKKIEDNPYLLTKIKGVGFKKADEIAKAVGFDMLSPLRINSALHYIVTEENKNGHSWITYKQLFNRAIELLNIDKKIVETAIHSGEMKDVISLSDDRYTIKRVSEAERYVAESLHRMSANSTNVFETEFLDKWLDSYCESNSVELEENQRKFFHDWNENNALLLIGSGGMGK